MKIKVGLIGFGRMGQFYLKEMQKSGQWDIVYICDVNTDALELAKLLSPESKTITDERIVFADKDVQVVGLFALADSRKRQIEQAIQSGKHIISEKPVSDTIDKEWEVVNLTEKYDRFSTVNLYLRNSWYHQTIKQFIEQGEIGELAILRICHMSPGLVPGRPRYEVRAFHDCRGL